MGNHFYVTMACLCCCCLCIHSVRADAEDIAKRAITDEYTLASSNIMSKVVGAHPHIPLLHPLEQKFISFIQKQSIQLTSRSAPNSFAVSPMPEKWFFQQPGKMTVILTERLMAGIGKDKENLSVSRQYMLSGCYKDVWVVSGSVWHLQTSTPLSYQLTRDNKPITFATLQP